MRNTNRKMKLSAGVLLMLGALSLLVLLAAGKSNGTDELEPVKNRLLAVATEAVQEQPSYLVRRSFVGRMEARRTTSLGFELSGAVRTVLVDEGDGVSKGQVLARLDTKRLRANRDELVARLQEAEARLSLGSSTRQRTRDALELNAVSTQQWDEADRGYAAQEAVVRRIQAQIDIVDVDIEKSSLIAPFAGVVAKRFLDEGAVVTPGEPLFRLLEMDHAEVRVGISAELAGSFGTGQDKLLRIDGREITATTRALLPERNRETRTVDVVLSLPSSDIALRHGDVVEVEVSESVSEVGFWLPRSALTESSRGLWACYVAEPESEPPSEHSSAVHVLRRRELELLHVDGDRVFVRGTVADGELVVIEGLQRLVPGQHVVLGEESSQ